MRYETALLRVSRVDDQLVGTNDPLGCRRVLRPQFAYCETTIRLLETKAAAHGSLGCCVLILKGKSSLFRIAIPLHGLV